MTSKEKYFDNLFLDEFPANLKELEAPYLERHILHLISTTNEDGSKRIPVMSNESDVCTTQEQVSVKEVMSTPMLANAVCSNLNPFKDYINNDDSDMNNSKRKHAAYSDENCSNNSVCKHCKLPSDQCLEKLFGPQMKYYFKKSVMEEGIWEYREYSDNYGHANQRIEKDFKRLLSQLKFSVAVMNGTPLPQHPSHAINPFLLKESPHQDTPLPYCIVNGSLKKFLDWLHDEQCVVDWGTDIPYEQENDQDYNIPLYVVNHYRSTIEKK